jgi:hypothetical protein
MALSSRPLGPCLSSSSDLFEDWTEANDMEVSVYVALTADASSSSALTATAPYGRQESHAGSSSIQWSRSRAAPLRWSYG